MKTCTKGVTQSSYQSVSLKRGGSSLVTSYYLTECGRLPSSFSFKQFAVTTQCRGCVVAHHKNLLKTIENNLALRGFKNFKFNSLKKLKILASDRVAWRDKFNSLAV